MNENLSDVALAGQKWHIDLDWYRRNNCSFNTLVEGFLCAKCRKRIKASASPEETVRAVSACSAHSPSFINESLPIVPSIFRIFLAEGNRSMTPDELAKEISVRRGQDTYLSSPEILERLLRADRYYGFSPAPDGQTPGVS